MRQDPLAHVNQVLYENIGQSTGKDVSQATVDNVSQATSKCLGQEICKKSTPQVQNST